MTGLIILKKIVISLFIFLFLTAVLLSGCETEPDGTAYELTGYSWQTTLKSGAVVTLDFEGDNACLGIKSGEDAVKISGKYLAGESELVIFMPEICQNYGFNYTPRGKFLDLSYEGKTITLKKR